ncbi:hypothetical protein LZ31DRAFT_617309 [Colletotrichum somersetense]|nr:hypothetical protein LZ31DRAFT_617309 [Colletotrichum somersetense]
MPKTTTSAKIGKPPNNARDYNIVKGIYRQYGITSLDPSMGFVLAAKPPENAVHESKQPAIIAGMVIVIIAIVVPVAARLWVRGRGTQTRIEWDDWVLCVGAALGVVYPILQILVVANAGAGTHIWENTYADYQLYSYYLTVCRLIYYPIVGIIKISITLLIRRLVETAYCTWRILADIFFGSLVAFILLSVFWNIFICKPARAVWDTEFVGILKEPATCGNQLLQAKVLGTIHVVQSGLLFATPIIILWRVRITRAKKIRLFAIWAVGGLSVTGGVLQQIQPFMSSDIFWDYTIILRWTTLDISLGILTACLPVLDAAIMSSWKAAKLKLGVSNRDKEHSQGTSGTCPDTRSSGPQNTYASSMHNIVEKDDGDNMDVQQVCLQEDNNNHLIQDTLGNFGRNRIDSIV